MDNSIRVEEDLIPLDFSRGIDLDSSGNIKRNSGMIYDCYVCVRPGNKKNVPKVYLEANNNTNNIVVHNFGHGGIGWSTNWGSVIHSINLVKQQVDPNNKTIAIIGAGCIGCSTALMLVQQGIPPSNITIYCDKMEDLTSHRSGAILSTASVLEEIDPIYQKVYDDINVNSYTTWLKILDGEIFPKLQHGVRRVKAYFGAEKEWGTVETDSGLDILVAKGLIPPFELVHVKFKDRLNLMRKYQSFYFNTFRLMKAFYEIIQQDLGITINVGGEIDPAMLQAEVVFNCTGLYNMHKDKDIHPIGGHIVTLKHQEIHKFDYVMYSHYIHKEDVGKYTFTNAPLFYLMLKTDDQNYAGLLGGSLCDDYTGGDEVRDAREYKNILKRTMEIFGEKSGSSITYIPHIPHMKTKF